MSERARMAGQMRYMDDEVLLYLTILILILILNQNCNCIAAFLLTDLMQRLEEQGCFLQSLALPGIYLC